MDEDASLRYAFTYSPSWLSQASGTQHAAGGGDTDVRGVRDLPGG